MMPWNSWNIYRLLVLFIYFSLPSFLAALGRQVALIPLKTRRMSHSPGTPSNGPPNNVQTREGTIRGNWCFHNRHLGAPQDQWVWSKEEWGERQGGKSWRRSEWAKNAVGACSRWLGVGSCQKVLQHHHAIRNRGHVAQTTLPHHPPLPPENFPPFCSQYLCVPECPTPRGSWRWKMHFSDSVSGVYWLWVLQLVEGYCRVYKAGVFAGLRSGLWLLPLAWLDWEELSI